jgi:anti-sigma-K factor RskA
VPHPSEDDLALLALGERVDDVCSHVRSCLDCERELLALTVTVDTARQADLTDLPPPPPAVWQRISDELGLDEPAAVVPQPRRRLPPTPWRRPLVAGGAALLAAAAAAVAVLALPLGSDRSAVPAPEVAAPLSALGQVEATGRVVLAGDAQSRSLAVDTTGLPEADGFYEVWLLDLEQGRMVALGALDDTGRGRLTVPEGVRLGDYPEVDVSLEPDDGDPAHSGDSVLRGPLPA